jgi:hypothetical protein
MLNTLTPLPVVGGVTQDEGNALGAALTVVYDEAACKWHKVQPSEHEHVRGAFIGNGVTSPSLILKWCGTSVMVGPQIVLHAEPHSPAAKKATMLPMHLPSTTLATLPLTLSSQFGHRFVSVSLRGARAPRTTHATKSVLCTHASKCGCAANATN